MIKNQDKNLNILRMKRAFMIKQKAFFVIFKGLLLKQIKQIFYKGESKGESLTLTCICKFLLQFPCLLILHNTIVNFTPVYTQKHYFSMYFYSIPKRNYFRQKLYLRCFTEEIFLYKIYWQKNSKKFDYFGYGGYVTVS